MPSSASEACRSTSPGLILIGLAVLLFILETTVTSHGLLTVGGLVCFVLGAFTLYTAPGTPAAPDVAVAVPLVVAMAAVTGVFVADGPHHRRPRPSADARVRG